MFELKLLLEADKRGNSCVFIWESSERCRHRHFTHPGALAPRSSLKSVDDWLRNSWVTYGQASQQAASPAAELLTWLLALDHVSYRRPLKTIPSSLDMTGTLSHLHWQITVTFFSIVLMCVCVCFSSYLQNTRERKRLSIKPRKRNFLTI